MSNYKLVNLGSFVEIAEKKETDTLPGWKIFLKDKLDLTSCEISVNSVPKGVRIPFRHKHFQNEETFIFVKVQGLMSVDSNNFPVKECTYVKVDPSGCRGLVNTGDEKLCYICIQAKANSLGQYTSEDGEKCE